MSPAFADRFFTTAPPGKPTDYLNLLKRVAQLFLYASVIQINIVVLVVKNLPANAGHIRDVGSVPGLGRSPGGGHGNLFQYSCLENPMDGGVHDIANSWT